MKKILVLMLLGLMAPLAFAITLPTDLAGAALDSALATVMGNLETVAMKVLFSLSMLQFAITGIGLYQAGEIDVSLGKFVKFISWTGFCLWLLAASGNADGLSNSGHFIKSSVDGFITLAGSWTATQGSSFSTSDIMMTGLVAYGNITLSVAKVTATNAVNAAMALFVPGVALLTLIMTFTVSLIVLVSCAYIALKVFMVKLELGLVLAMAPLSISLLGLQGLREQGFAPFKSMLALIYRTVVLGATVAAMSTVSKFLSDYVDAQAFGIAADVWGPLIGAAFGFVILAFVAHKSDSIASSLASGSAGLGSGDVASAAAIGAAVGAAVMTGGASMAAGATKLPGSMGDFMGKLSGGSGGAVSNASGMGTGGLATPPATPSTPSSSLSDSSPSSAFSGRTGDGMQSSDNIASGNIGHNFDAPPASPGAADAASNGPSAPSGGAGDRANIIGGSGSSTEDKVDKLLAAQQQGREKTFRDHARDVNQQASQEKSATHISINTHHQD